MNLQSHEKVTARHGLPSVFTSHPHMEIETNGLLRLTTFNKVPLSPTRCVTKVRGKSDRLKTVRKRTSNAGLLWAMKIVSNSVHI